MTWTIYQVLNFEVSKPFNRSKWLAMLQELQSWWNSKLFKTVLTNWNELFSNDQKWKMLGKIICSSDFSQKNALVWLLMQYMLQVVQPFAKDRILNSCEVWYFCRYEVLFSECGLLLTNFADVFCKNCRIESTIFNEKSNHSAFKVQLISLLPLFCCINKCIENSKTKEENEIRNIYSHFCCLSNLMNERRSVVLCNDNLRLTSCI